MRQESLSFLKNLLAKPTPSGYEMPGQEVVRKYLGKYTDKVSTDVHGNVHGIVNPGGKIKVMLAGHCDEIGLMIMHVDDKGFLYFAAVGGVNLQLLQGQKVVVYGNDGPVHGVVGVKPIHLMSPKERNSGVEKISSLWIDVGAKNKKEALELVTPGDVATIDTGWNELRNDMVSCRGFDDRIGAFVIAEAARLLKGKKINAEVHVVSTVQEELGLRGAKTASEAIKPDIGIAVDVGFATDAPGMEPKMVGEAILGEGPILHRGPNFNHALYRKLDKVAKKSKIKVQQQPIPRGSGTDANALQMSHNGCAAALISIPNRYMHSPVEVVNLKDVESSAELIAKTIIALKVSETFIP